MRRAALLALLLSTAALDACSSKNEPAPAPTTSGSVARFALPANGTIPVDAIPFPNDLYLSASGTLDLKTLPHGLHAEPMWANVLERLAVRRGFCVTCAVHFPIDGSIANAPKAIDAPTPNDAIVFLDVEEKKLLPIRVQWDEAEHRLSVRTVEGNVLLRKRKYAVAITSAIGALSPSPTFQAARDGGDDPAAVRARAVVGPALAALAGVGVAKNRVVALASFTTEDVLDDAASARALVQAAPKPVAVVDRVYDAAKLDELLGTPAEKLPGFQRPSVDPSKGKYAVLHDAVALAIVGRFRAPRVREGKGTEVGMALRDPSGKLVAGELEDVPFVLTLPNEADLTKVPIVVFHTGLGGNVSNGFGVADTFAKAGAAMLAIEPALHGSRADTKKDVGNKFRDLPEPDGFFEPESSDVAARFIGVVGARAGTKASPHYMHAAMLQNASDAFMAMRFVREGDLTAVRAADASLASLAFDGARVGWTGISNGSIVGSKIVALEPNLAAAVLNVPPASLGEAVYLSPAGREIGGLLLQPAVQIPVPDEVEKLLRFEPSFDFYRFVIDPMEPLALAPYLERARAIEGPAPDLLVQHAAHDELVAPTLADTFASALGIPGVGTYSAATVASATLPISANFASGGAMITAASFRYPGAMHVMLVALEEESKWAEPLAPPYKARPTPVMLKNPVVAVQEQIETFFRTRFQGGRARIE